MILVHVVAAENIKNAVAAIYNIANVISLSLK
jgi:hypothetical protein